VVYTKFGTPEIYSIFSYKITLHYTIRHNNQHRPHEVLAGIKDSVYWIAWFASFLVFGVIKSLLGAITAAVLPNIHASGTPEIPLASPHTRRR
jgi:hypothetical protein